MLKKEIKMLQRCFLHYAITTMTRAAQMLVEMLLTDNFNLARLRNRASNTAIW